MDVTLTIGDFSKMTYLSVKALRHYHDVGLLEPATIDPSSGYRRYATSQVSTAQAIRRFRDLDMPLDQIRAVLSAPDVEARNRAIIAHLQNLQDQLTRTQTSITSLQALLEQTGTLGDMALRTLPAFTALTLTGRASLGSMTWFDDAFTELYEVAGTAVSGPAGGVYPGAFFEEESGCDVIVYVPVEASATGTLHLTGDRFRVTEIGTGPYAVMVHDGPLADLDQTYGALGTLVAERGIGVAGPIREHYFDDHTEICWPVTAAAVDG
jgi:DNA-binding transcriptional MerR regulator/effector-binding domain-containing protein